MTDQSETCGFVAGKYEIFAGLDVDKHSMAVTFTDRSRLLNSLRLPYSSEQLLHYVGKHYPERRVASVYEAGPTGFSLYDDLTAKGYPLPGSGAVDGAKGAGTASENESAGQQETVGRAARGSATKYSCTNTDISGAAAFGAIAGHPGSAVDGD